jgi:hypothetical protein
LKSKQKKNLIKTAAFAAASISHMATAETNNTTALTEKRIRKIKSGFDEVSFRKTLFHLNKGPNLTKPSGNLPN